MFKKVKNLRGSYNYWVFNKVMITFHKCSYWDFDKTHSSIWIEMPYVDIKIKRNYKGHFIC